MKELKSYNCYLRADQSALKRDLGQTTRLAILYCLYLVPLKTIAFIAGKKNPAVQKIYIRFSIEIKIKK